MTCSLVPSAVPLTELLSIAVLKGNFNLLLKLPTDELNTIKVKLKKQNTLKRKSRMLKKKPLIAEVEISECVTFKLDTKKKNNLTDRQGVYIAVSQHKLT